MITIAIGTLKRHIQNHCPEAFRQWDGFSYKIASPDGLMSEDYLLIYLINEDKTIQTLQVMFGEVSKITA